jgi:ubiquinone/menaquinone biosynthesis C-methylase UbiE
MDDKTQRWWPQEGTAMSRSESSAPLYDYIGTHYDVTHRADPYLVERLIQHLDAERPGTYLDVACATGNYTLAVAQTSLRLHGLAPSRSSGPSLTSCVALV